MAVDANMTESEFLYRFRSGLVAAWIMPLAITFVVVSFLGGYSLVQLMATLQHLVSVYAVIGIALSYAAHDRYMRQTVALAVAPDEQSHEESERRVARFPYVFAGLYLPYAAAAPLVVNFSLSQQLGLNVSLGDHLFAIMGVTAPGGDHHADRALRFRGSGRAILRTPRVQDPFPLAPGETLRAGCGIANDGELRPYPLR